MQIFYRILHFFRYLPRDLIFLKQKIIWGFSDKVTWNFDYQCAKWILPRLKRFKKVNIGYPGYEDADTPEKWDNILDKMIKAFELIINEDFINRENFLEDQKEISEGLELFSKYFQSLWW